ncbi:unnamed protein product [Brassicogethes aeneus]|uniref:UDP-glucuronosyltransferase n=1 Tax=Brassicogethes aeneus TaxID=1431903 RepID=A0A9P0AUD2_BRAAE|nr:unnamed protein product [Brassicogethes aeneus]
MLVNSVLLLTIVGTCTRGAKILGVVTSPSYSHQVVYQPIWKELSLRGHQVTTIVTDGINDPSLTNLTEIVIEESYGSLKRHNFLDLHADQGIMKMFAEIGYYFRDLYEVQFNDARVKKIINDPKSNFDLVIFEAIGAPFVYFAKFNCSVIAMTSMDAAFPYSQVMGNPGHPLVNPSYMLKIEDSEHFTFKEKLASITNYWVCIALSWFKFDAFFDEMNRQHFGNNIPPINELFKRIDMLFVVSNPIFQDNRAVNPNTITLGAGLHIKPPQPLPKDLKDFLDNSPVPVVYFSLGTNVKGNLLNQTTKAEFYKAFSELPYKFLVKVDWENLTIPKNVKVARWLPQQDVLRHANVKLFITQGGLQSLQEAVTNAIPMVGIPFFGDQFQNVQKIVKRGIAVKLHRHEISKETIKNAITKVLTDPTYKQKVEEMRDLMYDEPMTSLDKAIWWIEYVLRHKGAPLFKSNAANMPMYEYLMLDVIGAVLAFLIVLSVFIKLIYKSLKFILSRLIGGYFVKSKKKRD